MGAAEERVPDDAFGLPHWRVLQLIGEALGIGGGMERLFGQDGGGLVVAVAVARRAGEREHDDVGPEAANAPDDVGENLVAAPFLQGLLGRLRETEVDGAGEVLLGAVDAARHQQFLGPDDAQQRALLGADQVLAAFAAGQGKIGRAELAALRVVGQRAVVFIVGMGRDHEQAADHAQLLDALFEDARAGGRTDELRRGGRGRQQGQNRGEREEPAGGQAEQDCHGGCQGERQPLSPMRPPEMERAWSSAGTFSRSSVTMRRTAP